MKLNVKELDYYAHDVEEESFEKFDIIYDMVMNNKMEVEEKNIVELCNIFNKPFKEIHPHQYIKIHRITFYVIRIIGEERGFYILIQGLLNMPKLHAVDYLRMFKYAYKDDHVLLFESELKKYTEKEQEYIMQCLAECGIVK